MHDQPYSGELFQIGWRPAPPGTYTTPDPSLGTTKIFIVNVFLTLFAVSWNWLVSNLDLGTNYAPVEQKKASAYVPPGMRNRVGPVGYAPVAGASGIYHLFLF